MVAGFMLCVDGALDPSDSVVKRWAGRTVMPRNSIEAIRSDLGEFPAKVLVVPCHDVYAEVSCRLDEGPRR
jgi:hypothetical protein